MSSVKKPVVSSAFLEPKKDALLQKTLRKCGAYYHGPSLFYQELWRERLVSMGFRVLLIQKLSLHHVWEVRVCGTLSAQTFLLLTKPVPKKDLWADDLLRKQLQSEIHEIAKDLGFPIQRDCINVVREGKAYFKAAFIWPKGRPGMLLKRERKPEAFSFLIQPWLRRNRN